MKKAALLILCLVCTFNICKSQQVPTNNDCSSAIQIQVKDYCSASGAFSNVNATESFTGNGKDVWFKFTATDFEVSITVTGNTLQAPRIGMMANCTGTGIVGSTITDGNSVIFTKGGLSIGETYFIWVSGSGNNTGTFQICSKSYNPPTQPGQDFSSASILCSTASFPVINLTGAGQFNREAIGTCLISQSGESNTAWFKWTAANNGTLVFTLTPSKVNDIDWVLYDLGPEGNTQLPSGQNAIRCAAGRGVDHTSCPGSTEPLYTKTGLDFNETDISEAGGCGSGQNGVVKFVTMQQGHVYALIIDNFDVGNNGVTVEFTDREGKAGTGEFVGPKAQISMTNNKACTIDQNFIFSTNPSNYTAVKWHFGEGASIRNSDLLNPPAIAYNTTGEKTVVLEVLSDRGCSVVYSRTFMVGLKPDIPIINQLKPTYCTGDTISLGVSQKANETYSWTGPNGFKSNLAEIKIPVTGTSQTGTYTVIATLFGCTSDPASIAINNIIQTPLASFTTDPTAPAKLAFPVTVRFFNNSQNADSFSWDFGDGTPLSTEANPQHIYTGRGNFDVTLTAFNSNACSASIMKGTFMVGEPGAIFIPNTFTPNNDTVNDEFVVNMNNIKTYRIQIFNRYGILMYSSTDLVENWKGTYQNQPVPVGTYYYVLDAVDLDNNIIKKSGSVTILR